MTLPIPAEPAIKIDSVQDLLTNMVVDAGIVGIDEEIEQPIINRAFRQINWLIAQWARKRWLVYRIQDYAVTSTGALNYTVGLNQTINISPRPDRLEYAYLRLNPTASVPVDIPMDIIPSAENYSRIAVKTIGTLPWKVFYDPSWPVGIMKPWPIPQASLYEMHFGFKVVLPRFVSLTQLINFPPEYEAALNWCGARRLRVSYQMPPDPEINALARGALGTLRSANSAMSTLQMPDVVRGRGSRAYDYHGSSDT